MKIRIAMVALALVAFPARADDFGSIRSLAQGEFRGLSEDLGAAFAYKGVTPAGSLGPLGFDVGLEVTDTRVRNSSAFRRAGADDVSHLIVPKLHVHKGLFGGLDVGAFVAGASDISATLYGADLRYAMIDDGIATPAVGFRLSGSRATGTGDLRVSTAAFDVMVSKKFLAVTPYAGAGAVRVQSRVSGSALAEERFNQGRFFAGVNLNLLLANFAFEAEKMGDNTSLSAKVGLRF